MNRIKELRIKNNLTQLEISQVLGVTTQSISLYERGDREPKAETWYKLARYFDVTIGYLMGYEE